MTGTWPALHGSNVVQSGVTRRGLQPRSRSKDAFRLTRAPEVAASRPVRPGLRVCQRGSTGSAATLQRRVPAACGSARPAAAGNVSRRTQASRSSNRRILRAEARDLKSQNGRNRSPWWLVGKIIPIYGVRGYTPAYECRPLTHRLTPRYVNRTAAKPRTTIQGPGGGQRRRRRGRGVAAPGPAGAGCRPRGVQVDGEDEPGDEGGGLLGVPAPIAAPRRRWPRGRPGRCRRPAGGSPRGRRGG